VSGLQRRVFILSLRHVERVSFCRGPLVRRGGCTGRSRGSNAWAASTGATGASGPQCAPLWGRLPRDLDRLSGRHERRSEVASLALKFGCFERAMCENKRGADFVEVALCGKRVFHFITGMIRDASSVRLI
jgi:hypothetical protein